MPQPSPTRKPKRRVAYVSDEVHGEFLDLAERAGESGGVILRGLVSDAIARGRRGELLVPRLVAGAPVVAES